MRDQIKALKVNVILTPDDTDEQQQRMEFAIRQLAKGGFVTAKDIFDSFCKWGEQGNIRLIKYLIIHCKLMTRDVLIFLAVLEIEGEYMSEIIAHQQQPQQALQPVQCAPPSTKKKKNKKKKKKIHKMKKNKNKKKK